MHDLFLNRVRVWKLRRDFGKRVPGLKTISFPPFFETCKVEVSNKMNWLNLVITLPRFQEGQKRDAQKTCLHNHASRAWCSLHVSLGTGSLFGERVKKSRGEAIFSPFPQTENLSTGYLLVSLSCRPTQMVFHVTCNSNRNSVLLIICSPLTPSPV